VKCVFCDIVQGVTSAWLVFEDDHTVAFLDARPLFPGHTLLIPREHHETLGDLPPRLVTPLFENTQVLSRAVQSAMGAEGTFVAVNNHVSQSVPHLHVHIVPRTKGDGLKGFFWPRRKYRDDAEAMAARDAVRAAISALQP
jgi:histidine triad (HIT) family protein